ncbi:MAG: biotin/lipoyl-containing protein [Candidatus Eisenbacteria bacterium]
MAGKDGDLIRLIGEAKTCLVRESDEHKGMYEVLSPAIGLYDIPPAVGTFVRPGSFVGYLTVMRRSYHLMVPEGHHGVVTHVNVTTRKQRVEFGQPLFMVSPEVMLGATLGLERSDATAAATDLGIPEGMFGIKSPTDGIFYRRANPQSPEYVAEGAEVSQGAVLALVEVMKCFNPIVYPGEPEFPPKGRITRILHKDATEVKHGALLFVVAPG